MAISKVNFRSDVLGKVTSMNIYLPDKENSTPIPVIYLLHGWSDNDEAWLTATSLERYASDYEFAIVMPQVDLSYYTDMVHGNRYWTFLSEELPALVRKWFRISDQKEASFVAGLSMGGYGATKLALTYPNRFNSFASLSGAMDVVELWKRDRNRDKEFANIFGSINELKGSKNDLFHLLQNFDNNNEIAMLQICGTEDFLYQDNLKFREKAKEKIEDFHYIEMPGDHNWAFWDQTIQNVLKWFDENYNKENN